MNSNNNEKESSELIKSLGYKSIPAEAAKYLLKKAKEKIEDEKADREAFEKELDAASDEELKLYIPSVYQKSIYKIDYDKLKENGIKLISFDIDDTLNDIFLNKIEANVPGAKVKMPEDAKGLFKKLKSMGFIVTLLTNSNANLAEGACSELNADGYISRANKPETMNFKVMQEQYGVEKSQMAHVGDNMRTDIYGGNVFGITTCLVRANGYSMKLVKFIGKRIGLPTKGKLIRNKLLKRDLWRKHHLKQKGDQYYQLGETPKYRL